MNSLPSLLLFLLNLFLQVQSQVCPRYWTALGSQCYRAFAYTEPTTENRTWSAARERCTNSGGYLVSVNDVQEDAIVNHVRRVAGIQDDCYYWIGLNDKDTEGRFMWLDGTAPTYFNWLLGEPQSNNPTSALAATEDFVLASGSKHWSDVRDDWTAVINNNLEPTGYVCEQDARPPPGPSGDPGPPGPPGIVGPPGNRGEEGPPGSTGDPGPPGEPGETGDQGPPGDQGSQGETGDPGALGQPGSPGPPGAVGDTGQQGIRGEPGVPGSVGPLGDQGLSGSEGPRGKPGPPGEPGDLGQPGETGDKGPDGDPGPPGIQGPDGGPGPIGEQGQQGIQGTPGVQGHPGDAGPPGPIGLRGDSGETGPIGPVGPQGPIGDKGEEGDQGIPGLRGDEGIPGTRGPQGRPGNSGAQGDKGAQGDEGPPGTAGPSGDKGAEGDQGEKGDTGDQGIVGPEGPPGTAGPSGDKGVKGDKGDPGDDGPDGTSGPRGVIGLPGPPGPPGPEVEFTGLPNNSVALPGGSIPYFINVTAYCINSGAGIFPHPLHCWQFVTCGPILGDMEVSCYAGRRFNTASGTCVTDPTCVFGAPNFGPISGTSPLISGAPPYVAEVERLKQTMRVYSGVVVGLLVSVGLLFPAVGWLYLTRKPVIVPNPNRNHRRLKEVECGSVLTNQV